MTMFYLLGKPSLLKDPKGEKDQLLVLKNLLYLFLKASLMRHKMQTFCHILWWIKSVLYIRIIVSWKDRCLSIIFCSNLFVINKVFFLQVDIFNISRHHMYGVFRITDSFISNLHIYIFIYNLDSTYISLA